MSPCILIANFFVLIMCSVSNANTTNVMPKTYPTEDCFVQGILQVIVGESQEKCAYECLLWSKCVGVSYNRQISACFLIDGNYYKEVPTVTADDTTCIYLNITEISLLAPLSAGACKERPCSNTSVCLLKGANGKSYQCVPKECPESSETKNAMVAYGTRFIRSTNSFRCPEGHTLFGNPCVICAQDGHWSKSDFQCYANCPMPSVSHADVIFFNPRLAFNTTAEFRCHDEYTMVGDPTITCSDNGEWTIPEFVCYPNCKRPNVKNAYVIMFDPALAFNTTAIFQCIDGYTAVGKITITCLSSGGWSKPDYECFPNCQIPSVENTDIITFDATLVFNTTATLQCHSGFYSRTTPLTITCESDGQWSKAESCFRHCSDPPMISNAAVQGTAPPYTMDMTVEYSCNSGYYPSAPAESVISCLADGIWTKTDFVCGKHCASLPSINNANLVETPTEPYTTASTAKYQCKWGYHHSGNFEAITYYHCNENGVWIGVLNCCLALTTWNEPKGICCLPLFC